MLKGQATFLLEFFLETILFQLSIFVVASKTLLTEIVTRRRRRHVQRYGRRNKIRRYYD
jgi:hypothetical protein